MEKELQKTEFKNGFRAIKLGGEAPILQIYGVNHGHQIKNSLDAQDTSRHQSTVRGLTTRFKQ